MLLKRGKSYTCRSVTDSQVGNLPDLYFDKQKLLVLTEMSATFARSYMLVAGWLLDANLGC